MRWLAFGAALWVSACSVNPDTGLPVLNGSGQDPLATLGAFTLTDLQNADALAVAGNDTVAHMCFAYLIPVVQKVQSGTATPSLPVSGAFSAFEAGRIAITKGKSLISGVPQDFNINCAPLILDAQQTVLALAAKVGVIGGAASVGIPLPLLGRR